jgi:hypothetical protein
MPLSLSGLLSISFSMIPAPPFPHLPWSLLLPPSLFFFSVRAGACFLPPPPPEGTHQDARRAHAARPLPPRAPRALLPARTPPHIHPNPHNHDPFHKTGAGLATPSSAAASYHTSHDSLGRAVTPRGAKGGKTRAETADAQPKHTMGKPRVRAAGFLGRARAPCAALSLLKRRREASLQPRRAAPCPCARLPPDRAFWFARAPFGLAVLRFHQPCSTPPPSPTNTHTRVFSPPHANFCTIPRSPSFGEGGAGSDGGRAAVARRAPRQAARQRGVRFSAPRGHARAHNVINIISHADNAIVLGTGARER